MKTAAITISNFNKYTEYMLDKSRVKGIRHIGVETSEGEVVGTASFIRYRTYVQLSSIYVRPEFRRQGAGHLLIARIREVIEEAGYLPMLVDFSDEAEGLKQFLENEGFFVSTGDAMYEFLVEDAVSKICKNGQGNDENIRPLSDITSQEATECADFMELSGWSADDLLDPKVRRDLSFASYFGEDICGIIVVSEIEEKRLSIERIAADNSRNMIFTALARASIGSMRMSEMRGTVTQFIGASPKLVSICKLMLGDKLRLVKRFYTAAG
jgi:N-acetylglutamate synthase-like GNAT family acetyltransferase